MSDFVIIGSGIFNLLVLVGVYAKLVEIHKELQQQNRYLKSLDDTATISDYRQRRKAQAELPEEV